MSKANGASVWKRLTESMLTRWISFALILAAVPSCAQPSITSLVKPEIPALPPEARISREETPSECLPTCLQGRARQQTSMRESLTKGESLLPHANGAMTH